MATDSLSAPPPTGGPTGGPTDAGLLLTVDGLSVRFRHRRAVLTAVDDISFTVAPGEVLGIVGESGAGKSITGAAVIGLIAPPGEVTARAVTLSGTRIDTLPAEALRRVRGRQIGMVFQDPLTALNPLFTVGEQLAETIRTHLPVDRREAWARAIGWLEAVGIAAAAERAHHYPHQFSGGMRQRVVIALALCAEPRLVIADEPTTALDVSIQAQVIALLKRLGQEKGTAIILITHDMGVIAETADRVAVMYAGRIVELGPVAEVIHRPHHPYTAGLMAAIPTITRRLARLTQIDGAMPRPGTVPAGCAFHPRCAKALARCAAERPDLEAPRGAADGVHTVACWVAAAEAEA